MSVVQFSKGAQPNGLQRVQATYTAREISRQFGLSEHLIDDGRVRVLSRPPNLGPTENCAMTFTPSPNSGAPGSFEIWD